MKRPTQTVSQSGGLSGQGSGPVDPRAEARRQADIAALVKTVKAADARSGDAEPTLALEDSVTPRAGGAEAARGSAGSSRPAERPPVRQRPELLHPREVRRQRRQAIKERRRYEREEVRRFTRRQRIRRRAWLIGAGVVVVVLGGAVVTAFSPAMALRTIEVVGTHRIKVSDVEAALAGQLGKPLPLVSLSAVGGDLSSFSLIRSYATELVPPSTLIVRIAERTPLGVVRSAAGFDLVDEAGVTVAESASQPSGYPLITVGAGTRNLATAPAFTAVAIVLAGLPSSLKVTTASAATSQSVEFQLSTGKKVIWGGTADSALQLADLTVLFKSVPGASTYDVSSPQSPVTR